MKQYPVSILLSCICLVIVIKLTEGVEDTQTNQFKTKTVNFAILRSRTSEADQENHIHTHSRRGRCFGGGEESSFHGSGSGGGNSPSHIFDFDKYRYRPVRNNNQNQMPLSYKQNNGYRSGNSKPSARTYQLYPYAVAIPASL